MSKIDPILCEIVQNGFIMIAEEAGIRASRSAGNPFVYGSDGIASSLFDRTGRLIAQSPGGLSHNSALRAMVVEAMKDYPETDLVDGDILLSNSQFRGGIHPTDVACIRPIFHEGEVAFYSAVMMLVSDLGGTCAGSLPANGTEIFHEGLILPPCKYYEAGKRNESILKIITGNSRAPAKLRSDVEALAGAGNVTAVRMGEFIEKYGLPLLRDISEVMLDHTEQLTRSAVSRIPDGVYKGEYRNEDDGIDLDRHYTIRVTITVKGSDCLVDFEGTDPQARGAINSSLSQSSSFVSYAMQYYLGLDLKLNDGFFRVIATNFPLGTVVNPQFPAACNIRFSTGQCMVDAMDEALRPVVPERSMAPSATTASFNAHGRYPDGKGLWSAFDVVFGGCGARSTRDAEDGMPWPMMGHAGYNRNVEAYEAEFPFLYHSYYLEPDSGGAGTWRGSNAIVKRVEMLADGELTVRGNSRFVLPPLGVDGGHPGSIGKWVLNAGREGERRLPTKATNLRVKAGDVIDLHVPGGGGYGDPRKRAPELVLRDVRSGKVSLEAARRDYGVAIDADRQAVDPAATAQLRQARS